MPVPRETQFMYCLNFNVPMGPAHFAVGKDILAISFSLIFAQA